MILFKDMPQKTCVVDMHLVEDVTRKDGECFWRHILFTQKKVSTRMRTISILFMLLLYALSLSAQQKDVVYVSDFGVKPYTYENCVEKLQLAIKACKERNARTLVFEKGRYDFWPEGAVRKEYFITNTSTAEECPSKVKTIGLFFEEMDGLTIEGNGATLMFHGKMTMIAFAHCKRMILKDIHLDFERPGGSEMTYTKADAEGVEVVFHKDSRYEIVDGKIHLYGEGWRSNRIHCIEYDPKTEFFFYSRGWKTLSASKAEEVAPGIVRFTTPESFHPQVGNTLTMRDIIRDQVGLFLFQSKDITLDNVGVHYMHGLGIVSQYTENITMNNVRCEPREGSGRILASSADFMHFSGCSGKISITGCRYTGAQDDPINVHGTNLRVTKQSDLRTLTLRFMHGQSYGFDAYFEGDTVAFVNTATMERYAYAKVETVKRLTDYTLELNLDRDIPSALKLNSDCVENMSRTPEVEIRNCRFTRTSTRGTLMTTPRKVAIVDNVYYKTGMSAILIEGDANDWFESGPVKDVLIKGNTFIECAHAGGPENAVIAIRPSNTVIDADCPVHRNIRIENNIFKTLGNPVLYAKSTQGLIFRENVVEKEDTIVFSDDKPLFYLIGCKDVVIKGNEMNEEDRRLLLLEKMKRRFVKTDGKMRIKNAQ